MVLRLRFRDYERVSRSRTLEYATAASRTVLASARVLMAEAMPEIEERGVTLVGVALITSRASGSAGCDARGAAVSPARWTPCWTRCASCWAPACCVEAAPWIPVCGKRAGLVQASFSPMSACVVTGGAGFLGSHLCELLLGRGKWVICVDNLETGKLENIGHLRSGEFAFTNHDITEFVRIEGPVDFGITWPARRARSTTCGCRCTPSRWAPTGPNMLGVAKDKRARFLLASTSEVYGDPEIHPEPEDYWGNVNPIGPRGVYDEAKRYAEALAMAYHRQQGVDTCIVRIFNTYGTRMGPHNRHAIPPSCARPCRTSR